MMFSARPSHDAANREPPVDSLWHTARHRIIIAKNAGSDGVSPSSLLQQANPPLTGRHEMISFAWSVLSRLA